MAVLKQAESQLFVSDQYKSEFDKIVWLYKDDTSCLMLDGILDKGIME